MEMIASFDEDEIGSRMTTNYIVITDKLTVTGNEQFDRTGCKE